MRQLGITWKAAWLLKHKLMEVMVRRQANRLLEGDVSVDDAYLGGERRRRSDATISFWNYLRALSTKVASEQFIIHGVKPSRWQKHENAILLSCFSALLLTHGTRGT
jgi:hypothetical protein